MADLQAPSVDALFQPFELKTLTLRNRIVMAPMTRCRSPQGVLTEEMRAWYRRRAEHGVGLVITEGVRIAHPGSNHDDNVPRFYGEDALAEWSKTVDDVHAAGSKIIPQLWHIGLKLRAQLANIYDEAEGLDEHQVGPSGLALGVGIMPTKMAEPMTERDIDEIIEAYASAAVSAQRIGCDGVALHGAHGYLIDQFFWEPCNERTDRYGGNIEKRSAFAADIIKEIRRRVGADFPIIFRLSQWKSSDYKARLVTNPQDLERVLAPIAEAGADIFDCSQRRFWEPEFDGSDMNLAGWARKVTDLPSITVGSISLDNEMLSTLLGESAKATRIDRLLEMLERGDFDLVAVGRSLIANPDWPEIVRAEAWERLKPYTPDLLEHVY
jgi:2,4-dienoyl-CoA reductase-like NADH-dependent reductase (Old Yellow Enzyme family)